MTSRRVEAELMELARTQYGLFTRRQALTLDVGADWIRRSVRSGVLFKEYSNVYRFAAVPGSWHQSLKACCLRAPGLIWASHRGAGAFWELDDVPAVVEVTSLIDWRTKRPDVVVHHAVQVPARDVTEVRGIAVTTVHRTLIDLGAVIDQDSVEVALECALRRRITSIDRLERRLGEVGGPGRRGARVIRSVIDRRGRGVVATGSALEVKFLQLLRHNNLPEPARQRILRDDSGFVARVDFEYLNRDVVIEVDSRKHHLRPADWERDWRRHNQLTSLGKRVLHVTYERIKLDPKGIVDEVARAIGGCR